jgi:hypothetical protein
MHEITSILNVRLCTAAGMSPFQNGLCERVHAITDMMLIKLAAENKNVAFERNARRILSSASVCMYALRVSCNAFKCFENASLHVVPSKVGNSACIIFGKFGFLPNTNRICPA